MDVKRRWFTRDDAAGVSRGSELCAFWLSQSAPCAPSLDSTTEASRKVKDPLGIDIERSGQGELSMSS